MDKLGNWLDVLLHVGIAAMVIQAYYYYVQVMHAIIDTL